VAKTTLRIGQLADRTGVSVSAIRFYERRGLLPEPDRVGGKRQYGEEAVRRLAVLTVAKQAGFSLDEIGSLLASTDDGAPVHERLRASASRKLPEVEALIEEAERKRRWLTAARACGCSSFEECALFGQ
jgi:MerR family redox-sensitive transcriptional activator SoxR